MNEALELLDQDLQSLESELKCLQELENKEKDIPYPECVQLLIKQNTTQEKIKYIQGLKARLINQL